MGKVEIQEFNGVKYRRYPESESTMSRNYFQKSLHKPRRHVYMHRAVWKHHKGDIPEGHVIHHIDEDTGNNCIDNLECMSMSDHARLHGLSMSDERKSMHRKHLLTVCHLGSEWTKTLKGREFISRHRKNFMANRDQIQFICEICNAEFMAIKSPTNKFCSRKCLEYGYDHHHPNSETRQCVSCNKDFIVNKKRTNKYCGHECYLDYRHSRKKELANV